MNRDLTAGKPEKVLWRFCLPLFGSVIFQQLYSLVDSWVAGYYIGEDALASIGNSYEITLIFIAFAFGCNMGCSVITSRFFGAGDIVKMKTAVSTAMIATGVTCAVLMILGGTLGGTLLRMIDTPERLLADSELYLYIYVIGLPFVFFYNLATGIFSAMGDSRTPFVFLAFSSLSNIVMDIAFVHVLGMRVQGVALATLICQGISCILALFVVLRRLRNIPTTHKSTLFSGEIFVLFCRIAVPSMLQQSFISIGNIIIQKVINLCGPAVIAGYSAGIKLNNLVITSFTTIGNGITTFTSQNLGAKKNERIREGFRAGLRIIWCLSLPLFAVFFIFAPRLIELFIREPSVQAIRSGEMFLRIVSPFYMLISVKLVADGVLRGAGFMKRFMIATLTDLVIRVVLAIVLSKTTLSYNGIWSAWPIGWAIGVVISVYYCRDTMKTL